MSRIIVKQLPKNITEEKLRSLFGSKGTVTDMQLKYTPDGKFRQFCFIGYRSEEDAQAAIKFFNNSCIQTSRIKVELCAALGAEDKPQSWSKYAKDSKKVLAAAAAAKEAAEPKQPKSKKKTTKLDEIVGEHKDDPEFQEFMKAHDKNRTLWANDAEVLAQVASEQEKAAESVDNKKESAEHKEKEQQEVSKGAGQAAEVETDSDAEEEQEEEDEQEASDNKLAAKPISDLEYMKSLMGKAVSVNVSTEKIADKSEKSAEKPERSADKSKKSDKSGLDLYTIKIHDVPYKTKRQEVLKFFKPLKPYSVRMPTNVHGFCYVGFKTEKEMAKAMLKNKSFIKGKQVFFSDFTEKNKVSKAKISGDAEVTALAGQTNAKWNQQAEGVRKEEDISESGKIFFRNLAYTVTEEDLQQVFEKFGPVAEINLPVDKVTRQIKGFGTVTFVLPEHAVHAFNKLDGSDFHGRLLHLIPGKSKVDEEEQNENDAALSFKQKKALKLKKTAQQSVSWNTLFLGPNAVAEILAKQFDTSKERILDTSEGGSSAAVRIALGETQIVIEMKRFLEENGVHLAAFDNPTVSKRSKSVILAKNLPAETSVVELTPIFAKFGPIGRIVLPPSGVTALIEFCDATEAKKAFKNLAYSRFKNAPLYLEWAPENSFKTTLNGEQIIPKHEPEVKADSTNDASIKTETQPEEQTAPAAQIDDELANAPPEDNTTLFLRNLNFKTVQDTVYNHFKHLGAIHTVEVAKRKDPDNPRQTRSLGYGFIQFKLASTAELALKRMQFTNIDGNEVELKRSDRTLRTNDATTQRKTVDSGKQTGTKILVRNIPFQAKIKEVRDIFKAFGELRTLRLPLKMMPGESTHRGFGFVDFTTKGDAKKAFEALSQSTHLYGRRLVLEWASVDEQNVDELRKRTAQQFQPSHTTSKRGKATFDADSSGAPAGTAGDDDEEMEE